MFVLESYPVAEGRPERDALARARIGTQKLFSSREREWRRL
jgi:hypothetical protein